MREFTAAVGGDALFKQRMLPGPPVPVPAREMPASAAAGRSGSLGKPGHPAPAHKQELCTGMHCSLCLFSARLNLPSPVLGVCMLFQADSEKQAEVESSEVDKAERCGPRGLGRLGPSCPTSPQPSDTTFCKEPPLLPSHLTLE